MKMRSVLPFILILFSLATGCSKPSSAQFGKDIKKDFMTNGVYLFHGMLSGTPEKELLKIEGIKGNDLKTQNPNMPDNSSPVCITGNRDFYGIKGKVMQVYNIDQSEHKFIYGSTVFYYTNRADFLKACSDMEALLIKNFGNPSYAGTNDLTEFSLNDFKNPPNLTNYLDESGSPDFNAYEAENEGHMSKPTLTWGDATKENVLEVTVYNNPWVEKPINNIPENSPYRYYTITLTVHNYVANQ